VTVEEILLRDLQALRVFVEQMVAGLRAEYREDVERLRDEAGARERLLNSTADRLTEAVRKLERMAERVYGNGRPGIEQRLAEVERQMRDAGDHDVEKARGRNALRTTLIVSATSLLTAILGRVLG